MTAPKKWQCTRCGNFKEDGCGMPEYEVAVPYETGIEWVHPACPLDLVTVHTGFLSRLWAKIAGV